MEDKILTIKDFRGREHKIILKLFLYEVPDFMGNKMTIPGIQLYTREDGMLMPYATLTKSFGEFIGAKNCAYIDTNNYSFAPQLLSMGFVKDTGFTKESGRCKYPLWVFEESFLREIGEEKYEQYSREYDAYMRSFEGDEDDE